MSNFSFSDDAEVFVDDFVSAEGDSFYWLKSVDHTGVVKPKMLTAPVLQTGRGLIHPKAGSWTTEKLLSPAKMLRWGFLVLEPTGLGSVNYAGIVSMIQECGSEMGMEVAPPLLHRNVQLGELRRQMQQAKAEHVQMLFVVLPDDKQEYYNKVKRVSELEVGILTQCLKAKTVRKGMSQKIIRNLLLKVNTKLRGLNQAVHRISMPPVFQEGEPVMIVGGHVYHPSPEQTSRYHSGVPCSIAAVTASIDTKLAKYNVHMSIQAPKKEEIVDLENMMADHLLEYFKHHQTLPTTIVYYRTAMPTTLYDESEFYEKIEITKAWQRTAQTLQAFKVPVYSVKFIFITVETPPNDRLQVTDLSSAISLRPGLVVNTHRIPEDSFERTRFSLVSDQVKGVGRLTNYFIFCNGGIRLCDLEQVSFYLCFVGGRGSRSLPYPAPLHYARLACRRALVLSYGMKLDDEDLEEEPRSLEVSSALAWGGRVFYV